MKSFHFLSAKKNIEKIQTLAAGMELPCSVVKTSDSGNTTFSVDCTLEQQRVFKEAILDADIKVSKFSSGPYVG